ncbi:MAG: LpqB family beta-propeller domain-containing protein [Dehalococcoidia bacterium]|jgi:Tol biopolymer transport system component
MMKVTPMLVGLSLAVALVTVSCGHNAAVSQTSPPRTASVMASDGVLSGSLLFLAYDNIGWDYFQTNADGSGTPAIVDLPSSDFPKGWSPDRTKYAYSAPAQESPFNSDVYVIDGIGGEPQDLTNSLSNEDFVSWSPDSTHILFSAGGEGAADYWTINADGTELSQIISQTWGCGDPTWSPDGKRLLFSESKDPQDHCRLYTSDEYGGDRRTFDRLTVPVIDPTWSPDGQRILFVSSADDVTGDVYVMNADGNDLHTVYHGAISDWSQASPAWSPDDSRIVIGAATELLIVDADGSNSRTVATGQQISYPTWSPDGERLAYISQHEGEARLYVSEAQGSAAAIEVSKGVADVSAPFWSYDGRRLLFASNRERQDGVYWMSLDGSQLQRIDELSRMITSPDSPGPPAVPGCRPGETGGDQGREQCVSPDGTRAVFLTQEEDGFWVDLRLTASGDSEHLVNVGPAVCGNLVPPFLPTGRSFAWSPDGDYLYYLKDAFKGNGCAPGFLYRIRADGTDEQRLADLRVGKIYGFAP